jgi:hypothetical protein
MTFVFVNFKDLTFLNVLPLILCNLVPGGVKKLTILFEKRIKYLNPYPGHFNAKSENYIYPFDFIAYFFFFFGKVDGKLDSNFNAIRSSRFILSHIKFEYILSLP